MVLHIPFYTNYVILRLIHSMVPENIIVKTENMNYLLGGETSEAKEYARNLFHRDEGA